jgi:hypothetical protein
MTRIRSIFATAALAAGLFCAACASTPFGATGYLDSYEGMVRHPDDPTGLRYVAPDNAMLDYDQLLFDAFTVRPLPSSDLAKDDPELGNQMASAFREKVMAAVEPYYDIVSEPGGGVLRMRCALTDLRFRGEGRAPEDVASVRFEAEMQNSLTGERVAAVVRTFDAGEHSAFDALAVGLLDFMNEQHGIK